jgi:hypothetical protein
MHYYKEGILPNWALLMHDAILHIKLYIRSFAKAALLKPTA